MARGKPSPHLRIGEATGPAQGPLFKSLLKKTVSAAESQLQQLLSQLQKEMPGGLEDALAAVQGDSMKAAKVRRAPCRPLSRQLDDRLVAMNGGTG